MEEMFSDAMNEAFEEEKDDDDDDDDDDKKKKTNDDDDDDESVEEFTGRFEGFETKKKPSLEDQVKKLQKDVEQMKLDM